MLRKVRIFFFGMVLAFGLWFYDWAKRSKTFRNPCLMCGCPEVEHEPHLCDEEGLVIFMCSRPGCECTWGQYEKAA